MRVRSVARCYATMGDDAPEWIRNYYDGDVPSLVEDPSGPVAIDGLPFETERFTCDHCGETAERPARADDKSTSFCSMPCALAAETGRDRETFALTGEESFPDFDDLDGRPAETDTPDRE